jgi:hypothetical protein
VLNRCARAPPRPGIFCVAMTCCPLFWMSVPSWPDGDVRTTPGRGRSDYRPSISGATKFRFLEYDSHAMVAAHWRASTGADSRDPVVDSDLIAGRAGRWRGRAGRATAPPPWGDHV